MEQFKRIEVVADYLGVSPVDLALGNYTDHNISISAETAGSYIGFRPGEKLHIGIVEDHAVRLIHCEIEPGHVASARAIVVRIDVGSHIHVCLCNPDDHQIFDRLAHEMLGVPSPFGREFPDVAIEHALARRSA